MATAALHDPDGLRSEISERYGGLSKRLRQIALYALEHPNEMALETIAVIAKRANVQPSTLIRFAKAFGYQGFSDMQRVFQARLLQRSSGYSERIRHLDDRFRSKHDRAADILREMIGANRAALENLGENIPAEALTRAIELLAGSPHVFIIGQRRSFPVAAYLSYVLSQVDRFVTLLDGIGGMLSAQVRRLRRDDLLVAITFHPYAPETAEVSALAAERGTPIVAITDSPVSPIARYARVCFEVQDAEVEGFRSLAVSMSLVQTLAIELGLRLERNASATD